MLYSVDRVLQNWVSVYDTNYVVGMPSIAETKQFMLKHGGVLEMAVKDCYQDRRNKVVGCICHSVHKHIHVFM